MQSFLGWIGGKSALRNAILNRFPDKVGRYIEVFGGAGWVLFGRDPVPGQMEVFNDADGELINIYRCVKYHPEALQKELDGLPDSREVFFDYAAQEHIRGMTDIQRAARSLYLIKISFGSDRKTFATAPKIASNISASFSAVQERLRKVIIENLDFEHLIHTYDRPDALFYCDPPYIGTESYYRAPFTTGDHWPMCSTTSKAAFCCLTMIVRWSMICMEIARSNLSQGSISCQRRGRPSTKSYWFVTIYNPWRYFPTKARRHKAPCATLVRKGRFDDQKSFVAYPRRQALDASKVGRRDWYTAHNDQPSL